MLLGTIVVRARVVVGYGPKGSEIVELTSKESECLVRASPPAVGAGTG